MSRAARTCAHTRSPTTPAATGTARSARARRQANGWPSARPSCCRSPYFHVVFTLPAPIADIAYQNKAVIYDLLFKAAAETLLTIAADPKHLGARIGITVVLHTWGSALTHHPHVHMIVPGGGISLDGERWIVCRPGFFLPVRVLSRLFRRLFLEKLARRARGRPPAVLRRSRRPRRRAERSRRIWRRCARPSGSSTPSARSPGPRRCWPICRATPTASPSPTAG